MKQRLFLTGPIGCGKSTAIEQALGGKMARCGGFRTRRVSGPDGHPVSFYLESSDGCLRETFLDLSGGKPEVDMDVFSRVSFRGSVLLLDEIGGIELLNPEFVSALNTVLDSDIPILGVIKGEGPAGALIRKLGLTEEYELAAAQLRQRLRNDPDTLVYQCGTYDETALLLARQWTEEYLHD